MLCIGVMGTIYKCHTELPLSKLGLDWCRVRKLTLKLNAHSIQYATKIINTSRRLKNIKERTHGSFQNPPDPHNNDLLPSLIVEVCLVLAPAVNFFLNSRNQGLPCWRSLSFLLSFFLSFFLHASHHHLFITDTIHQKLCILRFYGASLLFL